MTITNLIKVILSIDVNSLNRYEQIKACLQFIIDNGHYISKVLFNNCTLFFESLLTICKHQNRDLHKLGFQAMDRLLNEVFFISTNYKYIYKYVLYINLFYMIF